jgi:hypothetical protein
MYQDKSYGRKIVKGNSKEVQKRIIISWMVFILVGFVIGCGVGVLIAHISKDKTIYGTAADFKEVEMTKEWDAELGFVPLDVPMDEEMQEFIYCLSYANDIEFPFVMALITQESYFASDIISGTNDYGLMQINTVNHEMLTETLGVSDFLDPYQNTRSGIFILSKLFEKYEDPVKVLMAYNMGETGARRLWNKDVHETKYSNKIMKTAAEYTQQILEKKGEK